MSFPRSFKFDRSIKRHLFTDNQLLFIKGAVGVLGGAYIYTVYTNNGLAELGAQITNRADVTREGLGKLSLGELQTVQGSGQDLTDASIRTAFAIKLYTDNDQSGNSITITNVGQFSASTPGWNGPYKSMSYEWRKQEGLEVYVHSGATDSYIRQDDNTINFEDLVGFPTDTIDKISILILGYTPPSSPIDPTTTPDTTTAPEPFGVTVYEYEYGLGERKTFTQIGYKALWGDYMSMRIQNGGDNRIRVKSFNLGKQTGGDSDYPHVDKRHSVNDEIINFGKIHPDKDVDYIDIYIQGQGPYGFIPGDPQL